MDGEAVDDVECSVKSALKVRTRPAPAAPIRHYKPLGEQRPFMTHSKHLNPDGSPRYTNGLVHETSPYLRQHAHNPVDWQPWGAAAFERARLERKPIHLSIGYSACHWCHVMAAESFEDEATAELLNQGFINIKVDREERPDVDRIYQLAQQLLTRHSGGWPLTMFLTHEGQLPFFGGTYFPPEPRFGMPGFQQLLLRVLEYYGDHEAELREQGAALVHAFDRIEPAPAAPDTALTAAPLTACRRQLAANFDRAEGGFGDAPKFPHPRAIERLLRDWHATAGAAEPDLHALFMASLTLRRMGEGGINDQLGGGFCRYSVDAVWMIPHFEKMLYDNGALLATYAQAALATGDGFYAGIAGSIADWALRDMRSPAGAFYSSLDADSEGHEGRFYVWTPDEIRARLTPQEYAVFAPHFGLDGPPNFEGAWHLRVTRDLAEAAQLAGVELPQAQALLESARARLLTLRATRVSPGLDDKVLTSWNALMIRGLAIAARCLGRDDLTQAAGAALDFIRAHLWRDGRLLATASGHADDDSPATRGGARLPAYLDDYAYLADAILELQQLRFQPSELDFARDLVEVLLGHFEDREHGGFFFTADDHERLIHRTRSFADDAIPSGNGVAAQVLLRLGHLLGEPRYLRAAERTLRAGWSGMQDSPQAHVTLLSALEEALHPPQTVILRGTPDSIESWRNQLARLYAPRRLLLAIPADTSGLPPALADKTPRGEATAYVCTGSTCSAPIDSLAELIQELRGSNG